jgi:hypothetical protein
VKAANGRPVVPAGNDALHVSSVGVAVWPPMVLGLHVTVLCGCPSSQIAPRPLLEPGMKLL